MPCALGVPAEPAWHPSLMHRTCIGALAAGALAAAASSLAAPPAAELVLSHRFGALEAGDTAGGEPPASSAPLASAADVDLVLEERPGQILRGGPGGRQQLDVADYSGVGRLVVRRDLLVGPGEPPTVVPPGEYRLDLLAGAAGRIVLVMHGADGMRFSLPMGEAPPPQRMPRAVSAESFAQPGDTWVVALRLPMAGGVAVLTPLGGPGEPARRTRTEAIRGAIRDRLIHGAAPVRRIPR